MRPVSYLRKGTLIQIKQGKYNGILGIVIDFKNKTEIFIKTINNKTLCIKKIFIKNYNFNINLPIISEIHNIEKFLVNNKQYIHSWFKYLI